LTPDGSRRVTASLHINAGDRCLFVGPNGCGKTTVLDVIIGLRRLEQGRIQLANPREPIAYAVQDPNSGLLPWRTIGANIVLPATLQGKHDNGVRERATRLLERFRLGQRFDDYPYRLSGGEKQAVNLIRTLCTPCHLALLDEVLAPLHSDLRSLAKAEITAWLAEKTAILVTHDADDLDILYTRYLTIADGAVAEIDRAEAERILRNDV
jgi:NitT/TauT family transport system ATP-binding protein